MVCECVGAPYVIYYIKGSFTQKEFRGVEGGKKLLVSLTNGQKLRKRARIKWKVLLFELRDTSCINLIKRKDVIAKLQNTTPDVSVNITIAFLISTSCNDFIFTEVKLQ